MIYHVLSLQLEVDFKNLIGLEKPIAIDSKIDI